MCERFQDPAAWDDAALNLAITGFARTEAATAGHRLAAIAELATRRLAGGLARERRLWACDGWDSCAAEVAADLTISHRRASTLMHQGLDLRDRLPLLGALLRGGDITLRVATTASWRTHLIEDPDLLAKVDADIAAVATRFGSYSDKKLAAAIDLRIERYDPDAVRRFTAAEQNLDVRFGKPDDDTGTRSVYGRLKTSDAELAERRTNALAKSVCGDDPRTLGERRGEAWGIIAAHGDVLPCLCGKPDCPAPSGPDARGKHFEILVLTDDPNAGAAEQCKPAPQSGPDDHGSDEAGPEEHLAPDAGPPDDDTGVEPEPAACGYTSILTGGGVIPAPLLAELRRIGATVRTVTHAEDLSPRQGYRLSVAQRRLVWVRDVTCTFPGCDHPAEYCDLDHTTPYGTGGVTHPGNTKALCRKHHLLKTFWVGRGGWADAQAADGTIVWTSPAGLRYRAPPGSRIYFPDWDTTTPLSATPTPHAEPTPGRELRMPLRQRTRAQQQRDRIRAERERHRQFDADNPPPF
ncbi:MAG: hypothetical protein JWR11_4171 [Mycobacterium sp.]|jgi:hypothetical protein|nr:hypothetical protein [Mycobacterium sp.]MDT5179839.1 hypothetical protein [Mycobacterium sp.]